MKSGPTSSIRSLIRLVLPLSPFPITGARCLFRDGRTRSGEDAARFGPGPEKPLRDPSSCPSLGESPFVHVLTEALATDCAARTGVSKTEARYQADAAIQNLLGYLKEHTDGPPPPENVIIFDEAQRAWDAESGKKLMGRPNSEPELFLQILGRLQWSCLVCLVGYGQEINRTPRWQVLRDDEKRRFRLNAYRLLLTRSRAGTVIFVPRGSEDDPTRSRGDLDETAHSKHLAAQAWLERHNVPSPAFTRLRDFISTAMQMSHVYQPVMLRTLIDKAGSASVSDVAQALLAEDRAQLDYYREITKRMPGAVLRRRGIVDYDGGSYSIPGFDEMTAVAQTALARLADFVLASLPVFDRRREPPRTLRPMRRPRLQYA
jgi:hypothetical protein